MQFVPPIIPTTRFCNTKLSICMEINQPGKLEHTLSYTSNTATFYMRNELDQLTEISFDLVHNRAKETGIECNMHAPVLDLKKTHKKATRPLNYSKCYDVIINISCD